MTLRIFRPGSGDDANTFTAEYIRQTGSRIFVDGMCMGNLTREQIKRIQERIFKEGASRKLLHNLAKWTKLGGKSSSLGS